MARVILRGGTLVDGAGAPPRRGDLLISGETIAELDFFEAPAEFGVMRERNTLSAHRTT